MQLLVRSCLDQLLQEHLQQVLLALLPVAQELLEPSVLCCCRLLFSSPQLLRRSVRELMKVVAIWLINDSTGASSNSELKRTRLRRAAYLGS